MTKAMLVYECSTLLTVVTVNGICDDDDHVSSLFWWSMFLRASACVLGGDTDRPVAQKYRQSSFVVSR
jgi:hypothetical protein